MRRIVGTKRASTIIEGFKKARILVIGDLIMDHFIWGDVKRISPEAPVPVVDVSKETILLGGSANVVNNINTLGGRCLVAGIVGKDEDGRKLVNRLRERGISTGGIVVDPRRLTTIKTRVIAHSQQVVRFDRENRLGISHRVRERVFSYIEQAVRKASLVVVSDYSKGLISEELMEVVMEITGRLKRPLVVDPAVEHFDYYSGATLVTPNNKEAGLASGIEIKDTESLKRTGEILRARLCCEALLITRGEHGMSLFEADSETHIPTVAKEVYDVSGAGDTVVGVMSLSLAAGASFKEAAVLANLAAGIVVGKVGTATVRPAELLQAVQLSLKR
jgi:D-beta-D-heptose 7-phosphate kinase/D-beta-D-heptose 1-phosphate adenosyltransferase